MQIGRQARPDGVLSVHPARIVVSASPELTLSVLIRQSPPGRTIVRLAADLAVLGVPGQV